MSDLNYIDRTQEVKIAGQSSTGLGVNYVGADANGNILSLDYADGVAGSAVPPVVNQIGGSDGTNLRALLMDASGRAAIRLFDSAGTGVTLGQKVSASSLPIVIASDQSNVPANITQFGGVNVSTGTGASGTGIPRVTVSNDSKVLLWDATNTATIKAASTASVATDTAIVIALSPNSPVPAGTNAIGTVKVSNLPTTADTNFGTVGASTLRSAAQIGNATGAADFNFGAASAQSLRVAALIGNAAGVVDYNFGTVGAQTQRSAAQIGNATGAADFNVGASGAQTLRVAANLADGSANKITSDNDGVSANQRLHVAVPDTTTASTALGALNATIQIAMSGMQSSGFQLAAGTLIGTIVAEASVDGGTTWTSIQFYNPTNQSTANNVVFASSNALTIMGVIGFPGISHVRVRVSAYTSGTANAVMRASSVGGSSPGQVISAAFGTVTNTQNITATTATQLIAANTNRKYLSISNNGNHAVQIQFGSGTGLTTTTGLPIPIGGYYEFKGNNLYTGAVFGITSGTISISITEGTP